MTICVTSILVCIVAGLGAGIGTGLAGLSAAAVISPMLITFLDFPAYQAVGIALASDVLASAVSAYTYGKNKNLDIKKRPHHAVHRADLHPDRQLGGLAGAQHGHGELLRIHDLPAGRQVHRPTCHDHQGGAGGEGPPHQGGAVHGLRHSDRLHLWLYRGGGGMMMLLILTSVLGYELKTAVGTSVFIMSFTAFTGAVSHFVIGGLPDPFALILCVVATFVGARVSAVFANRAEPAALNRITGIVLAVLGLAMIAVRRFS